MGIIIISQILFFKVWEKRFLKKFSDFFFFQDFDSALHRLILSLYPQLITNIFEEFLFWDAPSSQPRKLHDSLELIILRSDRGGDTRFQLYWKQNLSGSRSNVIFLIHPYRVGTCILQSNNWCFYWLHLK